MTVYTIYVGKDSDIINRFSSYLGNLLAVAQDHAEAVKKIFEGRGDLPLMILYEKSSIKVDYSRIEYLKKEFPSAYIVLVANKIEKEEIPHYQKCGVNDTVHTDVSETRLKNGLEFVAKNQELIQSASSENQPLGTYKVPLWKRSFDIIFSVIVILILFPFLLVIAILIRIESSGPIIYKSKRVGSNYEIFDFLKFRSMYRDADKRLKEFMNLNQYQETELEGNYDYFNSTQIPVSGDVGEGFFVSDDEVITEQKFISDKTKKQKNNFVKYENDPRITKIGRFLRKFSIDELPQLINILKGDMSVVGNRPLPLYEAEQLTSDQYIDRFLAPAGLTGLWQVEKRGDSGKLSPEERKQLDIFYAKNFNLWMDIKIIFRTLTAFIQKENV
ncbi:MAG: sugar transferase [Bacteroidales bacterium]